MLNKLKDFIEKTNEKQKAEIEKRNAEENKEPTQETLSFFVAGTSFDNPDGTNRQDILAKVPKKIMKDIDEPLFGGYTKKEMEEEYIEEVCEYYSIWFDTEIVETEFEGEYAVEVYLLDEQDNKYMIGYVSRDDLKLFQAKYPQSTRMWLEIAGGRVKDCFGDIEERFYSPILKLNCKK